MTVRVKEHSREPIKMHTTSQSPRDADLMLRISTPPRVGRILRNGKMSYEFSVQDLETGLIFYEHIGRETGLRGDIDHFNLTLLNETKAWIREGRRYEGTYLYVFLPLKFWSKMLWKLNLKFLFFCWLRKEWRGKSFSFKRLGVWVRACRGSIGCLMVGFAWLPVVCERLMLYLSPFISEALPVRFILSKLF